MREAGSLDIRMLFVPYFYLPARIFPAVFYGTQFALRVAQEHFVGATGDSDTWHNPWLLPALRREAVLRLTCRRLRSET